MFSATASFPQPLKLETVMVVSCHIVPCLQHCYDWVVTSIYVVVYNYWKCYINVLTQMCLGFYWYIHTLPRMLRTLGSCMSVYISVKPITAVLQFINVCKRFIIKYASTWKLGLTWNIWQPNFSHFKTLHRISFIDKNQLKCTFNTITATLQWYKTKWNLND